MNNRNKKPDPNKPFPIRLGLLKPFLQRMAHDDDTCKGLADFIKNKLHDIVISDPIEGPKYQLQLKIYKQLKASKEIVGLSEEPELKGIQA